MKDPELPDRAVLALFDFDGTLTTKDSFMAFLLFTHGRVKLALHFSYLWPALLLYQLKILSNSKVKRLVVQQLYKNWPVTFFREKASVFCRDALPALLNPEAMAKLEWHRQQGHRVVVVTAMFEQVLETWCQAQNLELLATRLETENGNLTGNFNTLNCYGTEKARRVKAAGLLAQNPLVFAYGDSEGDKALLALADKPFYRCF
ncbi:MAG TPA: HAD family hydrolase [Adhaeribacter sp.]|nr:HAD family hydrolase [Adhaeribacter sp.]